MAKNIILNSSIYHLLNAAKNIKYNSTDEDSRWKLYLDSLHFTFGVNKNVIVHTGYSKNTIELDFSGIKYYQKESKSNINIYENNRLLFKQKAQLLKEKFLEEYYGKSI